MTKDKSEMLEQCDNIWNNLDLNEKIETLEKSGWEIKIETLDSFREELFEDMRAPKMMEKFYQSNIKK